MQGRLTASPFPPRPMCDEPRAVSVLVPVPLDGPFDYAGPDGAAVPPPGSFVAVPVRRPEQIGVVWDQPAARAGCRWIG